MQKNQIKKLQGSGFMMRLVSRLSHMASTELTLLNSVTFLSRNQEHRVSVIMEATLDLAFKTHKKFMFLFVLT